MNEETLFELLLNTPDDQRLAVLDQHCAHDPALRARLEMLLAAHEAPGSLGGPMGDDTLDHKAAGSLSGIASRPIGRLESGPNSLEGVLLAGKYKLIEPIGEGGMGSVWRARQVEPVKREVAVKLIKPGMDSRSVLARFEAERQALALMDHPNIARVLDAGLTPDGRPFFVMELVRGTPITEFCDLRRLNPEQRLRLFVPVCQAIQHAHQKGIIHRDIKPTNVLVALYDDKPVPKIIDFGVAKATGQSLTDHSVHTVFGGVLGTPQYMSPEQATFNNLDIDTRTDVYSLGALLYELLTGSPPFSQETLERKGVMEILRIVREEEPPKPSTKLRTAATLPTLSANRGTEAGRLTKLLRSELDWVVLKALEKDRVRRYETANAFAADIERYLHGEPVQAHPPSGAYRVSKFLSRHRGPAIAVGLLAVALILGVVGTSLGMLQAVRARAGERQQRVVAQAQSKAAQEKASELEVALRDVESERERAERSFAHGRILLAEAAWKGEGTVTEASDYLDDVPERFRSWEYGYLKRKYQGAYTTLYGHTDVVHQVAFSPDGSTLASASEDGTVRLWDSASGECLSVLTGGKTGSRWSVAYSSDGRRLAVTIGETAIQLWDPATGTLVREIEGSIGQDDHVSFSADGSRFAYITAGVVHVADAVMGESLLGLKGVPGKVTSVAFSPDGAWLAAAGRVGGLDGSENEGWGMPISERLSIVIPPLEDSETLESYRGRGSLHVWDSRTGEKRFELNLEASAVVRLAYSPDGTRIALRFLDQTMQILDAATGDLVQEFDHRGLGNIFGPTDLAYSPDGTLLATPYLDQSLVIWNVSTGARLLNFPSKARYWNSNPAPRFSPDGRGLLIEAGENTAVVWDISTNQRVLRLKGIPNASFLQFSPDGRRVAATPDKTIQLWDLSAGQSPFKQSHPEGDVHVVAVSPDGGRVASASSGKVIQLWDAASGKRLGELKGHHEEVSSLTFSLDGSRLVSIAHSTDDGEGEVYETEAREWDVATGALLRVLGLGHTENWLDIGGLAYSPEANLIATISSGDSTIRLWNLVDGSKRLLLQGHTPTLVEVAFSPDGSRLISGESNGTVRLWDTATGECLQVYEGHARLVTTLAFQPDGKGFASASTDGAIRLWDLDSTRCVREMWDYKGDVECLTYSPDSQRLATGGGDGIARLWDVDTGTHLMDLDAFDESVSSLAFSLDGQRLVAGSTPVGWSEFQDDSTPQRTIRVWELAPSEEPVEWAGHTAEISYMALSTDGRRLATVARDLSVRIWDTATGATVREIQELTAEAGRIGLSADGSRVVVEKWEDDTVRIWEVGTGKELTETDQAWPEWAIPSTTDAARSPDGRFLYVGTDSGAVRRIALEITPEERDYRRRMAQPDPFWHRQQAIDAEKRGLWRAARFHWKWLTTLAPNDEEARAKLADAEARLAQ